MNNRIMFLAVYSVVVWFFELIEWVHVVLRRVGWVNAGGAEPQGKKRALHVILDFSRLSGVS